MSAGNHPRRSREHQRRRNEFEGLELDEERVAAIRTAVRDRIARSFRRTLNEYDIDDATSIALVALLREHRRSTVKDPVAFAVTAGVRAAIKIDRDRRAIPFDPLDSPPFDQAGHDDTPLKRIEEREQLARIAEALEQLDDEKLAAFQLRFIDRLPHSEACKRLGIGRSAYFARVKGATTAIEDAVALTSHSFRRRQRQLLSDYVSGVLGGRARKRAERLIAADPQALVMARELQRAHRDAALLLPVLGVSVGDRTVEHSTSTLARLSETVAGWAGPGSGGEAAGNAALASGGARGAGAVSAGMLAKAFGGVGAGNVALACLGGGTVATVACVVTGVLPLSGSDASRPESKAVVERDFQADRARSAPLVLERPPVAAPPEVTTAQSETEPDGPTDQGTEPTGRSASTLETSTPPEVEEFGVAAAGTPVGGAPPDTNDSDGASASAVRQEFGP